MRGFGDYFHLIHPVKQSKKNVPMVCVKVSRLANGIQSTKHFRYYTKKNRDSKILTFQGVLFCPCLYRHGKRKVCGLQMRWSDHDLITEI